MKPRHQYNVLHVGKPAAAAEYDVGIEPSCADMCCLPRDVETVGAMNNWQATTLLTLSQTGVSTIVAIEVALHLVWIMLDLVPGFALYDGPAGSISAYTHTGWWMLIDVIVIVVGAVSVYFGLSYVPAENVVERGLARNENWIIMYMMMLGLGMISLILHGILSIFEVASCNSTLCMQNKTVLIVFIVGLFIDAFVLGWGILRAYTFQTTLKTVLVKWNVLLVVEGAQEQPPQPQLQPLPAAQDGPVAPSAPPENLLSRVGAKYHHQFKGNTSIPLQHKMK